MDLERFKAIVAAYGADARRWPQGERGAAQAFAASNREAAALRAEAASLDDVLDAETAEPSRPSDLLVARILARAPKPQREWRVANWRPAAALAACALFGLAVGFGGGALAPIAPQEEGDLIAAAVFSGGDAELNWFGEEG